MTKPSVIWSRSMQGRRPDLVPGDDRLLLGFEVDQKAQPARELVCVDYFGRQRWAAHDQTPWSALPNDRFLVTTASGEPRIINGEGETLSRWNGQGISRALRHNDLIFLADERQVWIADLQLKPLRAFRWPEPSAPELDCFVDGSFYYWVPNEFRRCTTSGDPLSFAELPADLIADAKNGYKRLTGRAAPDIPDIADRFRLISFDERRSLFFLSNFLPHMILCIDRAGRPRWCEQLAPGCCGGLPYRLPNGLYVASGGCNGILSWFDANGTVLLQTRPHEATGLAAAYSHRLAILPDGRILVSGGPGLVCYSIAGDLLWTFDHGFIHYECVPARNLLVGCSWRKGEPEEQDTTYLTAAVLDPVPGQASQFQ